ncbi:hypothetical protein HDU87_000688 [Geranomyces variabilis]|uniref:Uncharacterized protein n=1 Tax=Geranomyces variabilis TaxID=109894 RepID=A0AAD5XSX2_9FUNG|nr:hypothetical protein HDU87_000688 [Geranomyces variabilis]
MVKALVHLAIVCTLTGIKEDFLSTAIQLARRCLATFQALKLLGAGLSLAQSDMSARGLQ